MNAIKNRISSSIVWIFVGAYTLTIIGPMLYLLLSSFKNSQQLYSQPLAPPHPLMASNYTTAVHAGNLFSGIRNSFIVTTGVVLLSLAISLPAAYGIARIPSRLSRLLERGFAVGLLIPTFSILIPAFLLAAKSGFLGTQKFYIVFMPATALSFSIVVLVQFMRAIPMQLDEAATIDGASHWKIFTRIILPLSKAGLAVVAVFNFVTYWNEYLFSLVLIGVGKGRTVQVALPILQGDRVTDYGLVAAGAVVATLPILIVFIIFRRRMQGAMLSGAVKG
ncbi:MAG TPA: carbohydrate ABC transporter permease [Acidothermaceae bacterium]|jgi:multiple sugar transport system permease protein